MAGTNDKGSSSRLPIELYRGIVSHVQNKQDILPLLNVSKAFSYEAERILYRNLQVGYPEVDGSPLAIRQFMGRLSIAHHVHTLDISFIPGLGYSIPIPPIDFLPVLRSVRNLKVLAIEFHSPSREFIPDEVSFQLHTLTTSYPGDEHFVKFLESQKELRSLSWTPIDDSYRFNVLDLPVTTLRTNSSFICSVVLPSQKVERVKYDVAEGLGGLGQILSVRSISMAWIDNLEAEAQIFPNVQFLSAACFSDDSIFPALSRFTRLEKLNLRLASFSSFSLQECCDLVPRLFEYLEGCSTVEIFPYVRNKPSWRFKRGLQDLNAVVEVDATQEDEEWLEW